MVQTQVEITEELRKQALETHLLRQLDTPYASELYESTMQDWLAHINLLEIVEPSYKKATHDRLAIELAEADLQNEIAHYTLENLDNAVSIQLCLHDQVAALEGKW